MLRNKALVVLMAAGIGASSSHAAAQVVMYGSDSMFKVTQSALAAAKVAFPTINFTYGGTGSSQGGKAMNGGDTTTVPNIKAGSQQIAPQSRFLKAGECGDKVPSANPAWGPGESQEVGLDAIGIYVADNMVNASCALNYSNYGNDWRGVLRLLYLGQDNSGTAAGPCAAPAAARPATAGNLSRCNSPARQALVNNWGSLFTAEAGCTTGTCTKLRHAFRRDDGSGTTDTFLTLLESPTVPASYTDTNRPFCNGNEWEDLDPIRVPCDAKEQVCSPVPYNGGNLVDPPAAGGDLGVVLPISLPTDPSKQYGSNTNCLAGRFKYVPMPATLSTAFQKCPDGNSRNLGKCRWPQDVGNKFGCLSSATNVPSIKTFTKMDGRSYNGIPRDPADGALLVLPPPGTPDPRMMGAGAYHLHDTAVMANATGVTGCKKDDATLQIGCLVAADPCSIGFAGLQGDQGGGVVIHPLKVRNPDNTASISPAKSSPADIEKVLAACPAKGSRYSLSRILYMSASKGFANVVNSPATPGGLTGEKDFMTWITTHKTEYDGFLDTAGYLKIPGATFPAPTACASKAAP